VIVQKVVEAEVDEMWSFVGAKANPRWLWHALDHRTGNVLGMSLAAGTIALSWL